MQSGVYLTKTPPFLLVHPSLLRRSPGRCHIGAPILPPDMNKGGHRRGMQQLHSFRGSALTGVDHASMFWDAGAAALTVAGAYALVSTFDALTHRNLIQQTMSRKLVHILSGLLFMASWPLFSTSTGARYFASIVPIINCLRLLVHGLQFAHDEALIKSVTRDGNPGELLRGPMYYVTVLIVCALVFWRDSPVGVISVAMMCGGDGIADIMGRRFGRVKIPYNEQKSWAGSVSMFVFGFLTSIGMLGYFCGLGYFELEWVGTMERVALVSLVATVVESLPTNGPLMMLDDNISVPLASMLTASLCFP